MTTEQYRIPARFPAFQDLRVTPWTPRFHSVRTIREAADTINRPHEDYPRRIPATEQAISDLLRQYPAVSDLTDAFETDNLYRAHQTIFGDTPHGGGPRQVQVRIGYHFPPHSELIPKLLEQLTQAYRGEITDINQLIAWYTDFETIHPFQDGNGRVGGVLIALASHRIAPAQGFLVPGQ